MNLKDVYNQSVASFNLFLGSIQEWKVKPVMTECIELTTAYMELGCLKKYSFYAAAVIEILPLRQFLCDRNLTVRRV